MTANEQAILNDLVNAVENLAVSVDAIEAVLIRKGLLLIGEVGLESPRHVHAVVSNLAATRLAISKIRIGLR